MNHTLKQTPMTLEKYFTQMQKEAMVAAIQQAEKNTSGEIRVHIEKHCSKSPLDRAVEVFAELKMHKTALRNGVLIYIALEDKKLSIIGDVGINTKVPHDFWDEIKNGMVKNFQAGKISEGICEAIQEAGKQLKQYFPCQEDDINELSDEISFNDQK